MQPEIATIRDAASGATASVLVSQGFNCFRFLAQAQGHPIDVLYAPPEFSTGKERPSRGGIPLLIPFPGRIRGTSLQWQGKSYPLEAGDAFGNAIHGFGLWRPWRVIEQTEAKVVGEFQAWRDDPALKERWPADFRITASYTLAGNTLRGEYRIENAGDMLLPFGFGTHPYFRVPLGGAKAEDCIVKLPVSAKWELADMLPTGKKVPLPNAKSLQAGQRFGDLQLDDVFADLAWTGGQCTASIHDPASGITVSQRFDGGFRECVVFTPPHRQAICIEPYTCVPGPFELSERGIDAGLRVLEPGEKFAGVVEISVA